MNTGTSLTLDKKSDADKKKTSSPLKKTCIKLITCSRDVYSKGLCFALPSVSVWDIDLFLAGILASAEHRIWKWTVQRRTPDAPDHERCKLFKRLHISAAQSLLATSSVRCQPTLVDVSHVVFLLHPALLMSLFQIKEFHVLLCWYLSSCSFSNHLFCHYLHLISWKAEEKCILQSLFLLHQKFLMRKLRSWRQWLLQPREAKAIADTYMCMYKYKKPGVFRANSQHRPIHHQTQSSKQRCSDALTLISLSFCEIICLKIPVKLLCAASHLMQWNIIKAGKNYKWHLVHTEFLPHWTSLAIAAYTHQYECPCSCNRSVVVKQCELAGTG